MLDPSSLAFVRKEIAKSLNTILSGVSANADGMNEDIQQLFPGSSTIPTRPTMHPYGYVSRAPTGVIQVTGKQGNTPENRMVLGHRDANRPALNPGEMVIYNQWGQQIRLNNGQIQIGGTDSSEPLVLGNQLKALLEAIIGAITALASGTSAGFGAVSVTNPIAMAAALLAISGASSAASDAGNNFVSNDAILSDESFARKTGG